MDAYEIIILMTVCSFILTLLVGIACYNCGYLAGIKDELRKETRE